ncbi:CBO0543 family protein [Bacillus solitudinis]|uniref:CBO0543 family protein n=1 Tax=Bacillus solitudinis TaxID=2014074 RepID=UPI000C2394A3|nr:CBO0543 family protein [Bacillus solitudinis]
MKQTFEKNILRLLLIFGVIACANLIRKPPAKDWMIVFLFKGFLSSILDKLLVRGGYIKYPVQLAKCCDISYIFDYLLFPITCVYYNQVTKTSNIFGILTKTLCFSIPMSIIEHFLEKRTDLISFNKGWNSFISFLSMTITFLISRAFIAIIRKAPNKPVPEN